MKPACATLERTIASVIRGVAAKIAEEMPTGEKKQEGRSRKQEAAIGQRRRGWSHAGKHAGKIDWQSATGNRQSHHHRAPRRSPKNPRPDAFESELAQRTATPGVVTGLAYTPVGGEILFIEATQMPGKGTLQLTGQIGDVMKESVHAAFSLLKHNAKHLGLDPELFAKTDVHVHVPAGAVPKDGPSAGVAMYTALASLFTGKSVPPDVAMTGEITLRGLVLPIGGVKEKVIAAQRAGIKTVILPERNRKNLVEIREEVRKRFTSSSPTPWTTSSKSSSHIVPASAGVRLNPAGVGGRARRAQPNPADRVHMRRLPWIFLSLCNLLVVALVVLWILSHRRGTEIGWIRTGIPDSQEHFVICRLRQAGHCAHLRLRPSRLPRPLSRMRHVRRR